MLIKSGLPCKWCTSSDAMSEYADGWYCFSCGKVEKKETPTVVVPPKHPKEVKLPKDCIWDIPDVYQFWYKQYGLSRSSVCDFLWSPSLQSIIIPIYGLDGVLDGWIGKNFNTSYKKYHLSRGPRPLIYRNIDRELGFARELIIVEDILSAKKVAGYPASSYAALGTGNNYLVKEIKELNPQKVLIWLDGDEAGQRGARKLFKKLSSYIDCDIITTPKDPKEYSYTQIAEFINGRRDIK